MAPGLYAGPMHAESAFTRIDAAVRWAGEPAWIGGAASLFLVGALRDPPARIEVVVPRERRLSGRPAWVRVRRLSYAPPARLVGGWRSVEPAIAWCLGGAELPADQRASALCSLAKAEPESLERVAGALRSLPVITKRRALEALAATVASGAESYLEVHAFDEVFVGAPFDGMLRQHAVRSATHRYRLDLFDPVTMTALEIDGAAYHSGIDQWQEAIRRDLDLAAMGIVTVRFSYRDLTGRPDWCRRRALEVLRARGRMDTAR